MTKAERLSSGYHSLLCVIGKSSEACAGCTIAALEAQLAQREARIRELRDAATQAISDLDDFEMSNNHRVYDVNKNLQKALAADRLLAGAKEGEGK